MASAKELAPRGVTTFKVPFEKLQIVPGQNLRTYFGDNRDLGIRMFNTTDGLHNIPLVGVLKDDKFCIIHGESRYYGLEYVYKNHAALLAELPKEQRLERLEYINALLGGVPFILAAKGVTEADIVTDMISTNAGRNLNPLELAEGVKRLCALGLSDIEIAQRIVVKGKPISRAYVGKLKKLIPVKSEHPEFAKFIIDGDISPTLAIEIVCEQGGIEKFLAKHGKASKPILEPAIEVGEENSDGVKTAVIPGASKQKAADKKKKITRRDLDMINSIKFFKNYYLSVEKTQLSPEKREFFEFLIKVANNKAVAKDFQEYFKETTV